MRINKALKLTVIYVGIYAISNVYYQYGKGRMLRLMKEHNASVDEMFEILKEDSENLSLGRRINKKIVEFAATPKQHG